MGAINGSCWQRHRHLSGPGRLLEQQETHLPDKHRGHMNSLLGQSVDDFLWLGVHSKPKKGLPDCVPLVHWVILQTGGLACIQLGRLKAGERSVKLFR